MCSGQAIRPPTKGGTGGKCQEAFGIDLLRISRVTAVGAKSIANDPLLLYTPRYERGLLFAFSLQQ